MKNPTKTSWGEISHVGYFSPYYVKKMYGFLLPISYNVGLKNTYTVNHKSLVVQNLSIIYRLQQSSLITDVSATLVLFGAPMGFWWGFSWGYFSLTFPHGICTFDINYLKNQLKLFGFLFHRSLCIKKPHCLKKLSNQLNRNDVRNSGKMSIPELSVPLFSIF